MKLSKLIKITIIIAALAMVLALAACTPKGSLELKSFTIDRTSIKTNYLVGEEIDFSGIKAIARYSDETLDKIYVYSELTITYDKDITATEGEKEVTVSFDDPHLNKKQETKITIKVTKDPGTDESSDPLLAVQFEKPSSLTHFDSANSNAGKLKYGEAGFFGQFLIGGKAYVIGNENEFKLNPQFAVLSADDTVLELDAFYSVVDIFVKKNGSYVELTKTVGENNTVKYSDGETLMATVDTYKGIYQFSADAAGKSVKISVLPSEEKYIATSPFAPVVLEAKVIKAYNVYEAWQLAVIDNYNSDWNDIKAEHGLIGVTVSGIVFQDNIKITADDIPQNFLYTTDKEVVYTNTVDGSKVTLPAGTKFIKDEIQIYDRRGTTPFTIEGNFFLLDTSEFPRVPSPAVFGPDAEKDYKSDFSNVTLFSFSSQTTLDDFLASPYPDQRLECTISNLSLIGNAKRDYLIDANENLASAGGLIFCKSRYSATVVMDNIIGNSYFITYFPDQAKMNVNNTKCFDTYQNAAFVWGNATLSIENSYLEGCGGPVIIAQSVIDENSHPTVTSKNSVIKTDVEGTEIWFTAVGANTIVGGIKSLGTALEQAGLGTYVKDNKMNIIGALMAKGSDASQIITGIAAQGSIFVDGAGMDRYLTQENVHWATIKGISEYAQSAGAQMPPFFTVYDASGTAYTIYFNGTTFVDLAGNALGTVADHAALVAAFQTAEAVTLTQGGLSVVFEFYHN